MDASSLSAWASELDSKNTKRRLQALEDLGVALQSQPQRSSSETASGGGLACNYDDNSWQQIVAPLVRTLRDNNFKVCRASLACLESLVARVAEHDAARKTAGRTAAAAASGRNGSANSSIAPFLSLITPAVVECLGNSKAAVQEKGIDLLLAVSDPAVAGGRDTVSSLQRHFAGHRNWRVRERLVAYLGRVAELDPAGINSIHQQQQQQQRGGAAAETESSLLAGLLADALNDSASQVRQEALAAATGVVGMLAGNGGPVLLVSGSRFDNSVLINGVGSVYVCLPISINRANQRRDVSLRVCAVYLRGCVEAALTVRTFRRGLLWAGRNSS